MSLFHVTLSFPIIRVLPLFTLSNHHELVVRTPLPSTLFNSRARHPALYPASRSCSLPGCLRRNCPSPPVLKPYRLPPSARSSPRYIRTTTRKPTTKVQTTSAPQQRIESNPVFVVATSTTPSCYIGRPGPPPHDKNLKWLTKTLSGCAPKCAQKLVWMRNMGSRCCPTLALLVVARPLLALLLAGVFLLLKQRKSEIE